MLRFGFVFLMMFFCWHSTLAGIEDVDSLTTELAKAEHDTTRVILYGKLGGTLYHTHPDSALYYLTKGKEIAENLESLPDVDGKRAKELRGSIYAKTAISHYFIGNYEEGIEWAELGKQMYSDIGDVDGEATCINLTGLVYKRMGEMNKALEAYEHIIDIRDQLESQLVVAYAMNNAGLILSDQNNLSGALDYYQQSLKLKEELGKQASAASTSNNIGLIYEKMKETEKAMKYYRRSVYLSKDSEDPRGLAGTYNNIGNLHQDMGNSDSTLYYYQLALDLKKEVGDTYGVASTTNNIGLHYLYEADTLRRRGQDSWRNARDSARWYIEKGFEIRSDLGDKNGMASSLNNLGNWELKFGSSAKANEYCNRALDIAREIGSTEREYHTCDCLAESYEDLGDYRQAYHYLSRFYALDDTLKGLETSKEIARKTLENEYAQQRLQDSLMQVRVEEQRQAELERKELEEEQAKERLYTFVIGGGILGFGLLIALVMTVRGLRAKQRANALLEEKNTVILKQKEAVEGQKKEIEVQKDIIEEKNKEVLDSIQYARKIQSAILPTEAEFQKLFPDAFILFKPRDIVSGDFYWMRQVEDRLYVAVADCTGHGVPGAFVSLVGHNGLNRTLTEFEKREPGEILDQLNKLVESDFASADGRMSDGMDIALVSLPVKKVEGEKIKVKYAGANNPLWVTSSSGSKRNLSEVKADKQPIGKFAERKAFVTHEVELDAGDQIYLFSDGFQDQFGGKKGKKYKSGPFREFIMNISDKTMKEQHSIMESEFEKWRGGIEQIDDVCVIGVRV